MSKQPNSPIVNRDSDDKTNAQSRGADTFRQLRRYCVLVFEKLFTYLDAPFRYLFGRDIFISYSRADASKYAPNLVKELRAQIPNLSFYLDRWIAPPSGKLPRPLTRHLRWSNVLVLIATDKAVNSGFVKDEILSFTKTRRQIIPINVSDTWERIDWNASPWSDIKGAAPEPENLTDVRRGTPTSQVLDRILNSVSFTRQDLRLRRAVRGTAIGILVLIALAVGTSTLIIQNARAEAARRISVAETKETESLTRAEQAEQRAATADTKAGASEIKAGQAETRALNADSLRTTAETKRQRAESAQRVAQQKSIEAEARQARAEKLEKRASLVAQAKTAMSANNPLKAFSLAEDSLKIADSPDARLLLSEAYNSGIPVELKHFRQIKDLAVNPIDAGKIAAIGDSSDKKAFGNGLKLWDLTANREFEVTGYYFLAIEFSPDGRNLFASAITKYETIEGSGLDAKIQHETALIKYDLSLQAVEVKPINTITARRSLDAGEIQWDVRDILDMKIDRTQTRLIMAGNASPAYMRAVSNAFPYNLISWVSVKDLSMNHSLDTEHELSAHHVFKGRVELLSDGYQVITDGVKEVYAINMMDGNRALVGEHTSSVTDVAASLSGQEIAAVGSDNKLSIFSLNNGAWHQQVIELGGKLACNLVTFIGNKKLAVAREDHSITVVSFGDDIKKERLVLDGETVWEASREYNLVGHTARIKYLQVSPDEKWLVSAGEDKTIRLWPLYQGEQRVFYGNLRGVNRIKFSSDSKKLVSGGFDGTIRIYDVSQPDHFSLAVDPNSKRQEPPISDSQWDEGGGLAQGILRERLGFVRELGWDRKRESLSAKTYDLVTTVWDRNYNLVKSVRQESTFKSIDESSAQPKEEIAQETESLSPDNQWAEVTTEKQLVLHDASGGINKTRLARGAFSPDGQWFVHLSYDDNSIYIWDLRAKGRQPIRFEKIYGDFYREGYGKYVSHEYMKFSPEGRYVALPFRFDGGDAICVIELMTMRPYIFKEDIWVGAFDISDNGEIVVAGRTGEIYLHSLLSDRTLVLEKHSRYVSSVSFSSDGRWIASGSRDRTVRLWSRNGSNYIEFKLMNPVEKVLFSPSNTELLAASGRGIHAWYVPSNPSNLFLGKGSIGKPVNVAAPLNNVTEVTAQQSKNLAFILHRPGMTNKQREIEDSLGHSIVISSERMKELASVLTSTRLDSNRQIRAAVELGAYGANAVQAIPQLASALKAKKDSEVTELTALVIDVLRDIGAAAERPLVDMYLSSQDDVVKRGIAHSFPILWPDSLAARNALRASITDKNIDVRVVAALSLDKMTRDYSVIPILGEALYANHRLKKEASESLVKYGSQAAPVLIKTFDTRIRDSYNNPSALATESLVKIGKEAIPPLIAALKQSQDETLQSIIRTLGEFGPQAAASTALLIDILRSKEYTRDRDQYTLSLTARALGQIKAKESIPYIMEMLLDPRKPQSDASYALIDFGPASIPYLMRAYPTTSDYTKSLIVAALGEFGPASKIALPVIIDALKAPDSWTPAAAVRALGKLGQTASSAEPELIDYIERSRDFPRAEAIESLGLIGSNSSHSIAAIVKAIDEENKKYSRKFEINDESLNKLAADGVPKNVIITLERLKDEQPRTEEYFINIIRRELGEELTSKYNSLILKNMEYDGAQSCDKNLIYLKAFKALGRFGASASVPTIEKTLSLYPKCVDIKRYADRALQSIKEKGTEKK